MTGIFDYDTSWLNPTIKLVIVGVYAIMAIAFLLARKTYKGDLYQFFTLMFWMVTIGAIAALFRYFGHGLEFGFTKELSMKWLQGVGYLVQAILFVVAVSKVAKGVVPDIRE